MNVYLCTRTKYMFACYSLLEFAYCCLHITSNHGHKSICNNIMGCILHLILMHYHDDLIANGNG